MNSKYLAIAFAVAVAAAGCTVATDGRCDTEADCATGAECVDNLCVGGAQPTAALTGPEEVALDEVVTLDGSASAREDGSKDGLSYEWKVLSPEGASFDGASDQSTVKLRASVPHATYKVQLVTKDRGTASSSVSHEFKVKNSKPVAYLTASPETWTRLTMLTFDASASTDADDDALTYEWTLVNPVGFAGAIVPGTDGTATLSTGDTAAKYTVKVTVTDGFGGSSSETIEQTLGNTPPSIFPGLNQVVGHTCASGSCSAQVSLAATVTDVDGSVDTDSVAWSFKSGPSGVNPIVAFQPITIVGNDYRTTATITMTPDTTPIVGEYVFEVKASDNDGDMKKATITATVGNAPPVITFKDVVEGEPLEVEHSFSGGKYIVTIVPVVEVSDPADNDVLTVEFFEIAPQPLPTGVSVDGPTVAQGSPNTAVYTISVDEAHATSLINGTTPLFSVKAKVSDVNGGANEAVLPIVITNRAPVIGGTFFGSPSETTEGHIYGTYAGGSGYRQEFDLSTLTITDADLDPLQVTWTHTGGPANTIVNVEASKLVIYSTDSALVNAPVAVTMTVKDAFSPVQTRTKTFTMGNRPPQVVANSFKLNGSAAAMSTVVTQTCPGSVDQMCLYSTNGSHTSCSTECTSLLPGGCPPIKVDGVFGDGTVSGIPESVAGAHALPKVVQISDPDGDPVTATFTIVNGTGSYNRFLASTGTTNAVVAACNALGVCSDSTRYGFKPWTTNTFTQRDVVDTIEALPKDPFSSGTKVSGSVKRQLRNTIQCTLYGGGGSNG